MRRASCMIDRTGDPALVGAARTAPRHSARLLGALLLGALGLSGCRDHYRHGLRPGSLAEVKDTNLILYFIDRSGGADEPILSVSNEASDGSCLALGGVRVTVNGSPQGIDFVGGRSSGQTKGSIGPVDRTDSCDALRSTIHVPPDPARASDQIEVSDGTTTLRAEFPNLLTPVSFATPPPASARPGDVFRVRLRPAAIAGVGADDAVNFVGASLDTGGSGPPTVKAATRPLSPTEFEISLPKELRPGAATLYLSSSQSEIPATACSAAHCSAAQRFVLTAAMVVR